MALNTFEECAVLLLATNKSITEVNKFLRDKYKISLTKDQVAELQKQHGEYIQELKESSKSRLKLALKHGYLKYLDPLERIEKYSQIADDCTLGFQETAATRQGVVQLTKFNHQAANHALKAIKEEVESIVGDNAEMIDEVELTISAAPPDPTNLEDEADI